MVAAKYDVIIIGGGVMGSSIAYQLLKDGFTGKVAVFEKDETYDLASTPRSGGGYRTTFTTAINIRIGKYCQEAFKNFANDMAMDNELADIHLRQCGYMFLLKENKVDVFREVVDYQNRVGIQSYLLTPSEIKQVIPELHVDDLAGAVYSPEDGIFDPALLLKWYVQHAKRLGAEYIYEEIDSINVNGRNRITGVKTVNNDSYNSAIVINAAGAWAGDLSKKTGIPLPVKPLRRQLFHIRPSTPFQKQIPFTFDPTGVLFRHEGDLVMTGWSKGSEYGYRFEPELSYLEEEILPVLRRRCALFEEVEYVRGWAGLYEFNEMDHNGIVGEHPEWNGYYLATGFSGHGLMQVPAVAKGMSELIQLGKYETMDLTDLSLDRFGKKEYIVETTVV